MPEREIADSDRHISLTNMRRLDSNRSRNGAENEATNDAVSAIISKDVENGSKLSETNPIDKSFREVEIDGWKSMIKADSKIGRVFWIVMMILCLILMIYEISAVFDNYFNRPLSTSYQIVSNDTMTFPDIYICPMNGLNWTKIDEDNSLIPFAFYVKQVFGIQNYDGSQNLGTANAKMFNYTISEVHEKLMKCGYDTDEFMPICSFRQGSVSYLRCSDYVKPLVDVPYGKCFQFSLGSGKNVIQTVPGHGLSMTFNIHRELYPPSIFAPTMEGIKIRMGDEASLLAPGNHYDIEIRAEHLTFVNVDRGQVHRGCVGEGQHLFEYKILNRKTSDYNQRECHADCYYREIWNTCHCLFPMDLSQINPEILTGPIPPITCDFTRFRDCVRPLVDNNETVSDSIDKCKKRCISPCDLWRYDLKISSCPLYPLGYRDLLKKFNVSIDNIIDVNLFFPALEYAEFQQNISKSFDELISDVGGQVGLWLGASMITIIQIPLLLTTLCVYGSYKKTNVVKTAVVKTVRRFK